MDIAVFDYSTGTLYRIWGAPKMPDTETIEKFIDEKLTEVRLADIYWMEEKCSSHINCNPKQ